MASTSSTPDQLTRIFNDLKSRDPSLRIQAGADLRDFVSNSIAESSSNALPSLWDENINQKLFELTHSQSSAEAFGGLVAIDVLLNVHLDETFESKGIFFRFYNYAKHLLPNPDLDLMLAASKTLGRILSIGASTFSGERFMDMEVSSALALIYTDKQEAPRYAGVLILRELARNAPEYFTPHVETVLESILPAIRDSRVIVREGAAELVSATLDVSLQGDAAASAGHVKRILSDAQLGLKSGQPEVLHGSLLTYRELLLHPQAITKEGYLETAERVLAFKSHKDILVRRAVITMIPALASYDPQTFSNHLLSRTMGYLLQQLDTVEKSFTFIAIGHTATAVGINMKPFLESIMQSAKRELELHRTKRSSYSDGAVLQCIGMLAAAVDAHLTKLLHDQLELMLACGLSEALVQALTAIVQAIPPLLRTIQDRLLNLLTDILVGKTRSFISAQSLRSRDGRMADLGSPLHLNRPEKRQDVILAMRILQTFDFTGHPLGELARFCVLPYLEDDSPEVRRMAASSCCHLLSDDPLCEQVSAHAISVVGDVLDRILTVGVADPDAATRHTALSSLNEAFDRHLAQEDRIRSLFIALNDEHIENHVPVVKLIGRVSIYNPAHVVPSLRKTLLQFVKGLEISTVPRDREQYAKILGHIINGTQRLVKPYSLPILTILLPKANDPNPRVSANILICIAELLCVAGRDAIEHTKTIMDLVLPCLDGSSIARRNAGIYVLGAMCSSTGYVVALPSEYSALSKVLLKILKTENGSAIRREVIKVLGLLGAMDELNRTERSKGDASQEVVTPPKTAAGGTGVQRPKPSKTPETKDYYQAVVITSLLDILKDQTLNNHHYAVVEAIMLIFKTQGLRCAAFLPQIVPAFLNATLNSQPRLQEFHLQQIAVLASIVADHMREYASDVLALANKLWSANTNVSLQQPIIELIEAMGKALSAELKVFLPAIMRLMLTVFEGVGDGTPKQINVRIRVLDAFLTFGSNLEDYLHLIVPVLVQSYEPYRGVLHAPPELVMSLRRRAMQTISELSRKVRFNDYASRILHPLIRVLDDPSPDLRGHAMDTLYFLAVQFGPDFALFVPVINKLIIRHNLSHFKYERFIAKLLSGEHVPQEIVPSDSSEPEVALPAEPTKLTTNQLHLKQACDTSQIYTTEQWDPWMVRLSAELLKESPSHALRACVSLVTVHPPLSKDLFNASFLSCWTELYDQYKDDLVRSVETALTSKTTPPHLIVQLLDLAEFMEREGKPLPIESRTLGDVAFRNGTYAKALYYKETELISTSSSSPLIIDTLISINTRLEQHDAAWGALDMTQTYYDVQQQEEWYERLGRWEEALAVYDRKAEVNPDDPDVRMGRMKCLHALGEWELLSTQVNSNWVAARRKERQQLAPMAAAAAWSLNDWGAMYDYIAEMEADSQDRAFYSAVLSIHQNNFPKALSHLSKARDLLYPQLVSSVRSGYSSVLRAQILSELEEVIAFKEARGDTKRRQTIQETWSTRLQGCTRDVEVWQRLLQVRTLVLTPEEDTTIWVKFAGLCRRSGKLNLSDKVINSLLGSSGRAPPQVVYAHLKEMWAREKKPETLDFLRNFTSTLTRDVEMTQQTKPPRAASLSLSKLVSRCYYKQGEWRSHLQGGRSASSESEEVLRAYYLSTQYDPTWYKAWHTWALANFDAISRIDSLDADPDAESRKAQVEHAVMAVEGFFRSISLQSGDALQDTLRLLTLWFKFGAHIEVSRALENGFPTVNVDTWLDVVPQIIARIQARYKNVRRTIHNLLIEIGKHHPQALVYPLTVASKSPNTIRHAAARTITENMKKHSSIIVNQAIAVSHELVRVAILWHELWHEGLEEASRRFFTDNDALGMIQVLEPLHQMLEAGPKTTSEVSFVAVFRARPRGGEIRLSDIYALRKYGDFGAEQSVVFKVIDKQLPTIKTLDLQYVSPTLLKSRDLDVAVPDFKLGATLPVISSKQRPRRLTIRGDNGRLYEFGLKGREDMRQDERVMQFFGLVNTLLSKDRDSFKRRLEIQGYSVIPLAPNAGIFQWLRDIDTLHVLIDEHRRSRDILLNIEYRMMLQMAPDYETLTLLQKVEMFSTALENTSGNDLYRILWLKSRSRKHGRGTSSDWGDRHPANITMERSTGKIIHLDFGDCFELAMRREKFPEKVPFRLTRMLVHAMEVGGIEGTFRIACDISMGVLREGKESLMAVIEAFVYDPLMTWKLTEAPEAKSGPRPTGNDSDPNPTQPNGAYVEHGQTQRAARRIRADENAIFNDEAEAVQEVRNERALAVYNRVQHKLDGRDFDVRQVLSPKDQVIRLIEQATAVENLCQAFSGWCPFW